jgi:Rrf2 family iron-sulfur cluster assembly transcriptional regulator
MRVTKWGECGILCALYLAQRYDDSTVGASDIAETQGLDLQYTQQILHRLRKGNVIESVRGPKGGYRLVRSPEKTTLKEILYAAEGDTFQIICDHAPIHPNATSPNQCATKETCSLHGVWQDLRTAIDALLEQKTLADLLTQPQGSTPLVQLGKKDLAPSTSKV